jgi:mRNA interferase RelE/StbE
LIYELIILPRAERELDALPRGATRAVRDTILALEYDPWPRGVAKLKDREGWRVRAGDYRVIYEIDSKNRTVTILHVGHRREVYR